MTTKKFLAYAAFVGAIGLGAIGVAQPAAAQARMGDNNKVTQEATVKGALTALAFGQNSLAQNGVASVISSGGVTLGNNNQVNQKATVTGALTALAFGAGATAQNGVASIMSGK